MKKITSMLVALVIMATTLVIPVGVSADTAFTGAGTAADPYIITTADQLKLVSTKVNSDDEADAAYASASYKLMADIDLANADWTPIGNKDAGFMGDFDGNGHKISNVKINATYKNTGFFGDVKGTDSNAAEIKDLTLDTVSISCGVTGGSVGGMVGLANNYSRISGCVVKNATVATTSKEKSMNYLGAVIGYIHNYSTVENSYVNGAKLAGGHYTLQGGVFGGISNAGTATNCYAVNITDASSDLGLGNQSNTYGVGSYDKTYNFADGCGVTNCYSTLVDSESPEGRKAYAQTYYVGVFGATSEELTDKMLATGVYEADKNNTNGGYPVLKVTKINETNSFAGGSGTEADPYQIATAGQLKLASDRVNAGEQTLNFKLTADIDYLNQEWIPIGHNTAGDQTMKFQGNFDGDNHVIRNLKITNNVGEFHYDYIGLFGFALNGEIKNLGIDNIQILVNNNTNTNGGRIVAIGGLAGKLQSTEVTNCYVKNSSVKQLKRDLAFEGVGGFVGAMDGGKVTNAYVYNTGICQAYGAPMGGFVGLGRYGATFANCYASVTDEYTSGSNTDKTTAIYGFGKNAHVSNTSNTCKFTNCMSTLTTGSNGSPASGFDATLDASETTDASVTNGATADGIKAGFAITGFKTDSNINSGMPCLANEMYVPVAVHTPNNVVITSVTRGIGDDTTLTVKVRNNTANASIIYISTYNASGRLLAVKTKTATANSETTFTEDVNFTSAKTIKVFVWDSNIKPVANRYKGTRATGNLLYEDTSADEATSSAPQKAKVVLIGGSTVDETQDSQSNADDKEGWGAYIRNYLNMDLLEVANHGHNGATIQMITEGDRYVGNPRHYCGWDFIKEDLGLGAGDYVMINVNTNDEARLGGFRYDDKLDGSYTTVSGEIATEADHQNGIFLRKYWGVDGELGTADDRQYNEDQFVEMYQALISDIKSMGMKIILISTPPKGELREGETKFSDYGIGGSVRAIERVAALYANDSDVHYVDMAELYKDVLNNYANENLDGDVSSMLATYDSATKRWTAGTFFVDSLHFQPIAADLYAKTLAGALKDTEIFGAYVK